MPEITKSCSRVARLEDFFGDDITSCNSKYNKNNTQNDIIAKNQQEFGNRKRIKP